MTSTKRLAIVGAGAAGLCAARRATSLLRNNWIPYVFESTGQVGGTWIYEEKTGLHPTTGDPIHSSMYKGLRTNLPKEVMAFPDHPFPPSPTSFLTHGQVLDYLKDYGSCVHQYIQFNTKVVSVMPKGSKWLIETYNLAKNEKIMTEFDAVVICNGHYSTPAYGHIENVHKYSGKILHSHDYRIPDPFTDKRVIVFGAASSGIDIGIEISKTARKVYLSHNNPPYSNLRDIEQVSGVSSFEGDAFVLKDGSRIKDVDVLLYCTGYQFNFPFLHPDCGIGVDNTNRRVHDLYKHCINVRHPTMCLVGIPMQVCPFPLFDTQIQFFYKTLSEELVIPSSTDMLGDIQREFEQRMNAGLQRRHFHKFGDYQWEYLEDLARMGGFSSVCKDVEVMYNLVHKRRHKDILSYRETCFEKRNGVHVLVEKGI